MTDPFAGYAELEQRFAAWAQTQPALRAAVVVGSRARPALPDPAADLDLVLFTTTPAAYADSGAWLSALGPVWLAVRNATGRGDAEWLVVFAGGFKADFVLLPTVPDASLAERLQASPYRNVYRRGVRAVFNQGGAAELPAEWLAEPLTVTGAPDEVIFRQAVEAAWYAADRAARMLARGDLWRAKQQVDGALKQRLLELLAWHAAARAEAGRVIWDDGRHLGEWAEAEALAALPETFGAYAAADLWRALWATLALHERLARETAATLGLKYDEALAADLRAWWQRLETGSG